MQLLVLQQNEITACIRLGTQCPVTYSVYGIPLSFIPPSPPSKSCISTTFGSRPPALCFQRTQKPRSNLSGTRETDQPRASTAHQKPLVSSHGPSLRMAVLLVAASAVAQLGVMFVLTPADIPFAHHFGDFSAGGGLLNPDDAAGDKASPPYSIPAKATCFLLRLIIVYVTTSYGSRVSGEDDEVSGVAVRAAGCCIASRDDDPEAGAAGLN